MSWIRSGLQSIFHSDWLWPAPAAGGVSESDTDGIREAMLDVLGDDGARLRPLLLARIRYAGDAMELWNLRPELMTVASRLHGESEGARRLAMVTALFGGGIRHSHAVLRRPAPRAFRA